MLPDLHKQLHIYVFHEIVKGKYNPCLITKNQHEVLNNLVISANTFKVATLPLSEKPESYSENNDLTVLGYKSPSDYEIKTKRLPEDKYELYVRPLFIYDMTDVIDIPRFSGFRTNCFIEFMGDEFERMKIRAGKLLCSGTSDSGIREYATRHVQLSKNLFYDARLMLRNIQNKGNTEDIFIVFALNLFLVKTILFYQGAFKSHLSTIPDSEGNLFNEVIKELPLRKLCSLISSENTVKGTSTNKSYVDSTEYSEDTPSESSVSYNKTISDKKSQSASQGVQAFERIKVNGQINVLVDVFFQMLARIEKKEDKEVFFMETSVENLQNFFVSCFKDKNNKPYSWHTINTYLKSYRSDKRIKDGSKRKIDISGLLEDFEIP